MTLPIDLIRFLRGPYYAMASEVGTLLEGEGCEAGIIQPDGTCFEMLWLGGHDGSNKLVGGGFQTTSGQPQFSAPVGAALLDPSTCTLWFSTSYASGTGTGTGTGTGISGSWCKISEGGGGSIKEIDAESPIVRVVSADGSTVTISHAISGVTPGTYTFDGGTIIVDEWGHVTFISSGGGSGVTSRLYTNSTFIDYTGTTEQVFAAFGEPSYSYDIPAGTLSAGDMVRVRAWGSFTNAGGSAILYCGGQAIANQASNDVSGGYFSLEFECIVIDSTTLTIIGTGTGPDSASVLINAAAIGVSDLSTSTLNIKLTGDNTGTGSVQARGMAIWKE